MINLKERVETLIEAEMESNTQAVFDAYWNDSIMYYEDEIKGWLAKNMGEISPNHPFIACMLENVDWWLYDGALQYISAGFPFVADDEFALANVGELEIDKETLKDAYHLDTNKKSVRDAINSDTDLYINNNGYGYINSSYDFIGIIFSHIDFDSVIDTYLGM